tara:strand:+ start:2182 stop:3399 length:1218 start_codon:yes stop_codon:yes gene_type:complete
MTGRVVITGLGINSSLGNNQQEVLASLQTAKSGIEKSEQAIEKGLRSQIEGTLKLDPKSGIDRKQARFMGETAALGHVAMAEAIADAGLTDDMVSNERTGLIVGSGGVSNIEMIETADILHKSGVKRVGPYRVPKTMTSTASACLATNFKVKGTTYSISSACATSAHCIGNAYEQIQFGKQDIMFAGGSDELHWSVSVLFDAMGALSSKYNDTPTMASRPFDVDRDGFVITGGAGILVLESLEHAKKRGANIYAELVGYGASSDGFSLVQPSGEGAIRCMQQAISSIDVPIDYINAHGTSTPIGDAKELEAIEALFGSSNLPMLSSTKSLTGHALGAAGVHEAIYTLLMMKHGFVTPSVNIETLTPEAKNHQIVQSVLDKKITTAMSNNFGFGGVNASLIFKSFA